jgi:hypothetical protein
MLSTIAQQIIEAGGFLLLPAKIRDQFLGVLNNPLPMTTNKRDWFVLYNSLGIPELAQLFLVENDIRLILGKPPADFKFMLIDDRLKIKIRNNLIGSEMQVGNLSTEYLKWVSGIPRLWIRSKGIYLNCHHLDGNHRNDTSSNLGLIRASRHGRVHNSRCTLNLNTAPCIPLAHLTNNKFGIDWLITENGIERSKSYKPLDVERDVLPLLDQIEKGGLVSQYKTIEDVSMKKMVTQKTL